MHDLDRTQLEFEPEEGFEVEEPEIDAGEVSDQESPFTESEEMELATELLEVSDDAELDHFLGNLMRKVMSKAGKFMNSSLGRSLGGILKGAARKALPIIGGALGSLAGPMGTVAGTKLAADAGRMFGLELEGLSDEDMEFETARRFVRFAADASQQAELAASRMPRHRAARYGAIHAARRHAPGLLARRPRGRYGAGWHGSPAVAGGDGGRWERRGSKIIIYGV